MDDSSAQRIDDYLTRDPMPFHLWLRMTVTQHIHRLRHKLEEDPNQPRWLRTVRGVGYRFEP